MKLAVAALVLICGGCAEKKHDLVTIVPTPVTCLQVLGVVDDAPDCKPARLKSGKFVNVCNGVIVESDCVAAKK